LVLSDIKDATSLTSEEYLSRMIDVAKITVAGLSLEEKLIGGNIGIEDFTDKKLVGGSMPEIVKTPSMLIMSCNLLEVLRLREELIQRIHETDILTMVYRHQLKITNKDSIKLIL
jgi:hypothetical protein